MLNDIGMDLIEEDEAGTIIITDFKSSKKGVIAGSLYSLCISSQLILVEKQSNDILPYVLKFSKY